MIGRIHLTQLREKDVPVVAGVKGSGFFVERDDDVVIMTLDLEGNIGILGKVFQSE